MLIGYLVCKKSKIKYEVNTLLIDKNIDKADLIIKSFARFAFFKGKIFVSYTYLPNDFWLKCFPTFSLSRKIPMYLTIKTSNDNLLKVNNWLIQGGDIQ